MIIAEINTLSYGSTGKIMFDLAETARKHGHTVYTYSAKTFRRGMKNDYPERPYHTYFGSEAGNFIHKAVGGLTGFNGYFSSWSTRKLINQLEEQKIDILHLHNLHEFCINLPMLFGWIKTNNIRAIWTLHDCWTFTGHCPHFTAVGCDKWETGCGGCPQKNVYPKSYLDTTAYMWKKKREWFTGVKDLTIVTPSEWLAGLVKESYLSDYPVRVINNGIDLSVFQPVPSEFREKHGIADNVRIILGVSMGWNDRKGLDVFQFLAEKLDDKYQIVLLGTDNATDQKLPENIISIHRTANQKELAEIYTASDLFVNPTREDTYPTVNMESIACGTPVLTFMTGGSPEMVTEETGAVVPCDDVEGLIREIERICTQKPFSNSDCVHNAQRFDKWNQFSEYMELYEVPGSE